MGQTQAIIGAPEARVLRRALAILGVAAGYWVGGVVGTVLSVPPSGFAILWPSTAFLIAVLMITPVDRWYLLLAGVIPAHCLLAALFQPAAPLPVILSQVAGNIGLAAATVLILRARNAPPQRFDTSRATLRFIVLAAIAIPAIGNSLILCLHLMTGWTETFWLSWRQWMLASLFPTITIPPLFLGAADRLFHAEKRLDRSEATELTLLCALLFCTTYISFGWQTETRWWPELVLISLPVMLWIAVRFDAGATSLSLLIFAGAIVLHALEGRGPFAVGGSPENVLALQVFLTALSIPLLLLSSLTEARRRTTQLLQQSEARMELVASSTETGLWQWDRASNQFWMTDVCRTLLGIAPGATVTRTILFDLVHHDDRERVRAAMGSIFTSPAAEAIVEFRIPGDANQVRWFAMRVRPLFDENNDPLGVAGVFRDITQRVDARRAEELRDERLASLQEEERQKIVEEMHENTAQHLVAARLSLSALQRQAGLNDATGSPLEEIRASLNQAAIELRTFSYLLRPTGLDREGLCTVLRRHVEGFTRRTGLTATLTPNLEAERLTLEQQRAVLRIVQESMSNAHRHASATRISVHLRRVRDDIHIVVRDDGDGLSPPTTQEDEAPSRLGVGIPGMIARVNQLNGKMVIRSRSGGMAVHVALPLGDHAPPERRRLEGGARG